MTNPKQSQPTKVVYVGPNLTRGRLLRYRVFIGGLPTHLDEEFQKCPNLKKLFVDVANLNKAEIEIMTAGTPLNKYFAEAAALNKED